MIYSPTFPFSNNASLRNLIASPLPGASRTSVYTKYELNPLTEFRSCWRPKRDWRPEMSREIVIDVLGKKDTDELWGAGYWPALPVTPQDFELGGILPTVIYMLRWERRRGRGQLAGVYGKDASVMKVAEALAQKPNWVEGFEDGSRQNMLADLLLAFCLENK